MGDIGSSAIEERVEEIWKDVLGVSAGETNATFSELGGRGMSALRIVARIENELGVRVEVGDLFDHQRLDAFVRHVMTKARTVSSPDEQGE
ncbi:phosphopantetheine-binding protein [Sphaerisporangium sp. NPDC088356]|uniref:phosphopantetheine-binding protein n=1 Tax=Sphaerisporangium sp. NPDC088356 TaxID=3154871 RepID=UPI003431E289